MVNRAVIACNVMAALSVLCFVVAFLLISQADRPAPVDLRTTFGPVALPPVDAETPEHVFPEHEEPRFECVWFRHCALWV